MYSIIVLGNTKNGQLNALYQMSFTLLRLTGLKVTLQNSMQKARNLWVSHFHFQLRLHPENEVMEGLSKNM